MVAGSQARPGLHEMTEAPGYQRILLIKPSSLGDVIHALPVLHGLRVRFPDAHIAWLISTACAPIIRHHPELSEVIEFDRRRYGRITRSLRISREFAGFVADLRTRRFDLAIDLQGLFRSGVLTFASGAPVRVGFRGAREFAWLFYTHEIPVSDVDAHAVEKNFGVAGLLGFADVPLRFDLAVTEAERHQAADVLRGAGIDLGHPFAAVLPGARWDTKRWLPERYASALSRLATASGLRSVLLGAPNEADLCAAVASQVSAENNLKPVSLAGRTGVRELVAILERAAVVVCQDSAPAHLAAALGRPTVCILGPTNSRRTGPYGAGARLIQADVPCSPCYLRSLNQCRFGHECMHQVEVDTVVCAVVEQLRLSNPARTCPADGRSP